MRPCKSIGGAGGRGGEPTRKRVGPNTRSPAAFAAGLAEETFWKFILFTFLGSFCWSLLLTYIGQKLGQNWPALRDQFHNLDLLVILVIIAAAAWWINRHIKNRTKESEIRK